MDVERIQKINSLALDLLKQGLAADREEAVTQAEKIFRHKDSEDHFQSIRKNVGETGSLSTGMSTPAAQASALSQDSIQAILQQNTTFVVGKFKEFGEKITALEKEINSLKTKQLYGNSAPRGGDAPIRDGNTGATITPPPDQARGMKQEQGASTSHPRVGNYKNEDVSIEKIFYMGSK